MVICWRHQSAKRLLRFTLNQVGGPYRNRFCLISKRLYMSSPTYFIRNMHKPMNECNLFASYLPTPVIETTTVFRRNDAAYFLLQWNKKKWQKSFRSPALEMFGYEREKPFTLEELIRLNSRIQSLCDIQRISENLNLFLKRFSLNPALTLSLIHIWRCRRRG